MASCKKQVLEIVPVIDVTDISLPTSGDIKSFSFPTDKVGYAAVDDTSLIFKTEDGGHSWSALKKSFSGGEKFINIEFYDEINGLCLTTYGSYETNDGGVTWTNTSVDIIGISKQGTIIRGYLSGNYITLYKSTDNGQTYENWHRLGFSGTFISAKVTENKCFILTEDNSTYYVLKGIDLNTKMEVKVSMMRNPTDVYFNNDRTYAVYNNSTVFDSKYRNYNDLSSEFYSIDGYNDLTVAVGKNKMVTNMNINSDKMGTNTNSETPWNELRDHKGQSFKNTFYKIKFRDAHTFYVGGANGLLWKAKI